MLQMREDWAYKVKLSKANVACTREGDNQLKWDHCFTVEAIEQKSTEAFVNYAGNKKDECIIDSGCSHHVTGNGTLFSKVHEHHGDRVIVTTDNSTHPVPKEGIVMIDVANDTSSVKLHDVYHVPGLTKNLVSIPQITDSEEYVLLGPKDVKVLDNVKERYADVIFSGEKKCSLFVMSAGEAYVKKTSQTNNAAIWHARLGHVGYQLLQHISSKKLVDGMPTLKNVRVDVICQATTKFITSRDMVFDEVSSPFSAPKFIALGDDQDNLELLFPEANVQAPRALTAEEPISYEEARGYPNWERAMQEEIDALDKNETWELVSKPEKCEPVTCKWVFRLKKNFDDTIDRFKFRLIGPEIQMIVTQLQDIVSTLVQRQFLGVARSKILLFCLAPKLKDGDQDLLLLCSLPPSYEHLVTILLDGKDIISMEEVEAVINFQELRKNVSENREEEQDNGLIARARNTDHAGYKNKEKLRFQSKDWFVTCRSFDSGKVFMGNDVAYKVVGTGLIQIKMHDSIVKTLTDVRHFPELRKNLISLGTLDSNGCTYRAAGGVMMMKGALVVMKSLKQNSLYMLQDSTVTRVTTTASSSDIDSDTTKL
ncbi:hypothetical protein RJ639_002422 [Escallonia herrerae]|uniref:Retrovirus-related Pol polyprotein from transposon TNT 1-94 n=1 Tax=Escallonia herrerae TaxID=1293975 RepID=A0AA89BSJ6_9ASTE|nr:hypothetical protein RJ639_002422 [Escallonia herrerae]